jgi:hypothetical protein
MTTTTGELPDEFMALTNDERIDLIRKFSVGDIVSPPGHVVLRCPEAMLRISKMLCEASSQPLTSEPIVLNVFPKEMVDGSPGSLTVYCVDGTHRLVAGLHARMWQIVGDIPREMLQV